MPVSRFAMILIAVLAAAGVTVLGLSLLGPQALAIALPLALTDRMSRRGVYFTACTRTNMHRVLYICGLEHLPGVLELDLTF